MSTSYSWDDDRLATSTAAFYLCFYDHPTNQKSKNKDIKSARLDPILYVVMSFLSSSWLSSCSFLRNDDHTDLRFLKSGLPLSRPSTFLGEKFPHSSHLQGISVPWEALVWSCKHCVVLISRCSCFSQKPKKPLRFFFFFVTILSVWWIFFWPLRGWRLSAASGCMSLTRAPHKRANESSCQSFSRLLSFLSHQI